MYSTNRGRHQAAIAARSRFEAVVLSGRREDCGLGDWASGGHRGALHATGMGISSAALGRTMS